jgi:hypothetical protein
LVVVRWTEERDVVDVATTGATFFALEFCRFVGVADDCLVTAARLAFPAAVPVFDVPAVRFAVLAVGLFAAGLRVLDRAVFRAVLAVRLGAFSAAVLFSLFDAAVLLEVFPVAVFPPAVFVAAAFFAAVDAVTRNPNSLGLTDPILSGDVVALGKPGAGPTGAMAIVGVVTVTSPLASGPGVAFDADGTVAALVVVVAAVVVVVVVVTVVVVVGVVDAVRPSAGEVGAPGTVAGCGEMGEGEAGPTSVGMIVGVVALVIVVLVSGAAALVCRGSWLSSHTLGQLKELPMKVC